MLISIVRFTMKEFEFIGLRKFRKYLKIVVVEPIYMNLQFTQESSIGKTPIQTSFIRKLKKKIKMGSDNKTY